MAAQNGHLAVVQYLIQQGADKNKAKNNGTTPLIIAAQEGQLKVVQCLVQQGADKGKTREDGADPAATSLGQLDVVRQLVQQKDAYSLS